MAACCGVGRLSPSIQAAWRTQPQNPAERVDTGSLKEEEEAGLVSGTLVRRDRTLQESQS